MRKFECQEYGKTIILHLSRGDLVLETIVEELAKSAQMTQDEAVEAVPPAETAKEEAFSEKWQPEFEQPMGEYVPPQPIIFHPRSRLRELKRKLVAGPERRYYEISEIGFGKLQIAIFLSFLVVVLSAGATALYALGMVSPARLKLMVFCQIFAMLLSALLGCYQMMDGVADIFKKRFSFGSICLNLKMKNELIKSATVSGDNMGGIIITSKK